MHSEIILDVLELDRGQNQQGERMSNFFGNSSTIHDGNDAGNVNRTALVSPDKPTYFKKKVCYSYVNDPE